MRFSLIIATLGRSEDLKRLFDSLCAQTHKNFEVIVVDASPSGGMDEFLNEYAGRLEGRRVGSVKGHSRALNLGLLYAQGDVIAFPDDDCWYEPTLLQRVAEQLQAHPEWSGLSGRSVTASGDPSSGRWDHTPGPITRNNVWRRAVTISIFLRRSAIERATFDETLGLAAGTPWGAGEETDFLLQVLQTGAVVQFDPDLTVRHPEWGKGPYTSAVCAKARSYGRGIGRVLHKHNYALMSVGFQLLRPLGGALLAALSLQTHKARYHWAIFTGRTDGWTQSVLSERAYRNPGSQHAAD
jgi:glycosyltransferase involved in cell wall biosynthesis